VPARGQDLDRIFSVQQERVVAKDNTVQWGPKEVHPNAFAQRVLASIPKGEPDDRLFPDVTAETVSMAFNRTCKALGIEDTRLHDCRHTFATWLWQRGTELDIIASQLGHRDLRMTKRYARIASAQVRNAVDGLDEILEPRAAKALPEAAREIQEINVTPLV
jgi:integrase